MPEPMTVLVTGAAKRLGAIIARHLASNGHRVVVHYGHSQGDAKTLVEDIRRGGGVAATISGDLSHPDAARDLIAAARAAFDRPTTGLVNSASQFRLDTPEDFDPALLRDLADVNLATPIALIVAMAAQPDLEAAAVVNVLDQKVANLNPDFLSYTLTKVALEGATTMLAQAFAPKLRVNAVSPGLTLPSGDQSEAEFRRAASKNLLRRPVDPDGIARAVAYLLSADGVTGQNLFVDNGQRFLKRDGDVMFEDRDD